MIKAASLLSQKGYQNNKITCPETRIILYFENLWAQPTCPYQGHMARLIGHRCGVPPGAK